MDIKQIAKIAHIGEEEVLDLNPSLRRSFVPALHNGFELILPLRVICQFENYLSDMEIQPLVFEYRTIEYRTDADNTIFEIAQLLKVDPYLLKHWNQISSHLVKEGQQLIIHELYNPNLPEPEIVPHKPEVRRLEKLPVMMTLQDFFAGSYQIFRRKELEKQNWDVHLLAAQ